MNVGYAGLVLLHRFATMFPTCYSSVFPPESDAIFFSRVDEGELDQHMPLIHACHHVPHHSCRSKAVGTSTEVTFLPSSCSICPQATAASTTMFAVARYDGVGERLVSAVMYLAFASFSNLSFGGFLYNSSFDDEQNIHGMNAASTLDIMSVYLGSNVSQLNLRSSDPRFDRCWRGLPEGRTLAMKGLQSVLVYDQCRALRLRKDLFLLSQPFLKALRQSTQLLRHRTDFFRSRHLKVAIHLRRGDILRTTRSWWPGKDRMVPDSLYMNLLRLLRQLLGSATEIHIFSVTSKSFPSRSFNSYRHLGAQVHLDGDILEDWAHMAQADVLIVAPSAFSWVAGLLNSKCVVALKSYPFGYLPKWIRLSDDLNEADHILSCIHQKTNMKF